MLAFLLLFLLPLPTFGSVLSSRHLHKPYLVAMHKHRLCRPRGTTTSNSSAPAVPSSTVVQPSSYPTSPISSSAALASALFPIRDMNDFWTTSSSSDSARPLSDSTLRPSNMISAIAPQYVVGPDDKMSIKVHFALGSWAYKGPPGGVSFYAPGPASVDLTNAKEATFGYSVHFASDFAFNKGGKLPGLYGGNSDSEAIGCSGGRHSSVCFSARLMWRTAGAGELYTYLPPFTENQFSANKKQCSVPPLSDCNPVYGASIGRGSFHFVPGQWTTVSQRVRLNDVGVANGEIELFVNGQSAINVDGLVLRDSTLGRIRGIQMQSFFGGSTADWASPKDQDAYFSDFSVAITQML